jgi:hypothetical protein
MILTTPKLGFFSATNQSVASKANALAPRYATTPLGQGPDGNGETREEAVYVVVAEVTVWAAEERMAATEEVMMMRRMDVVPWMAGWTISLSGLSVWFSSALIPGMNKETYRTR